MTGPASAICANCSTEERQRGTELVLMINTVRGGTKSPGTQRPRRRDLSQGWSTQSRGVREDKAGERGMRSACGCAGANAVPVPWHHVVAIDRQRTLTRPLLLLGT